MVQLQLPPHLGPARELQRVQAAGSAQEQVQHAAALVEDAGQHGVQRERVRGHALFDSLGCGCVVIYEIIFRIAFNRWDVLVLLRRRRRQSLVDILEDVQPG